MTFSKTIKRNYHGVKKNPISSAARPIDRRGETERCQGVIEEMNIRWIQEGRRK